MCEKEMIFKDRIDAGKELGKALKKYKDNNTIVLGLTRGGIPVAFEIAQHLHVPLDAICIRKLGVPYFPELGMGAIGPNAVIYNEEIISRLNISKEEVEAVKIAETAELKRRLIAYRGTETPPDLEEKTVILVDDGLATGGSMKAAIESVKSAGAVKVIVGIPVGPPETVAEIRSLVDHLICLHQPLNFNAVGAYYYLFTQVSDEEVKDYLKEAKKITA